MRLLSGGEKLKSNVKCFFNPTLDISASPSFIMIGHGLGIPLLIYLFDFYLELQQQAIMKHYVDNAYAGWNIMYNVHKHMSRVNRLASDFETVCQVFFFFFFF